MSLPRVESIIAEGAGRGSLLTVVFSTTTAEVMRDYEHDEKKGDASSTVTASSASSPVRQPNN